MKIGKTATAMSVSVLLLSGLVACSKAQQNEASNTADNVASDAGSLASDASSAVSDAVVHDTPQEFVTKAGNANMLEIESSKLAIKTSKNKDVLAFAKLMVGDHTKAATAFKAAATASGGLTLPTTLDPDYQKKLDDLKATPAVDFDAAYIHLQKDAHKDAVMLFDSYAKNGTDANLTTFATDTLPTLKAHKDAIDKL